MKKIRGTKAFTLIELLVVIAIIALLMGILLPSLRKARASAWKATCGAHLHQIAVALEVYEVRYDDKRFAVRNSAADDIAHWMGKLAPYVGDPDYEQSWETGSPTALLLCPAAPASKFFEDPSRKIPPHANSYWGLNDRPYKWGKVDVTWQPICSYTINGFVTYDYYWSFPGKDFTNWLSVRPEVPLFGDGLFVNAWPQGTNPAPPDLRGYISSNAGTVFAELDLMDHHMWRFCINRHSRKVNLIFKDLHVEAIGLENLWELPWHRGYKPPTSPIRLP